MLLCCVLSWCLVVGLLGLLLCVVVLGSFDFQSRTSARGCLGGDVCRVIGFRLVGSVFLVVSA